MDFKVKKKILKDVFFCILYIVYVELIKVCINNNVVIF